MPKARHIVIEGFGGPEVMMLVTEDIAPPAPGEVQIRQTAIGLNLIDTYQRRGVYPLELPSRLGFEAAGTVEALGFGVAGVSIGDRVAYMNAGIGALRGPPQRGCGEACRPARGRERRSGRLDLFQGHDGAIPPPQDARGACWRPAARAHGRWRRRADTHQLGDRTWRHRGRNDQLSPQARRSARRPAARRDPQLASSEAPVATSQGARGSDVGKATLAESCSFALRPSAFRSARRRSRRQAPAVSP